MPWAPAKGWIQATPIQTKYVHLAKPKKKNIPWDEGCMFYLPIHEWVDLYGNLDQSHGFYALPWVSLPTNLL